MSNLTYIERPRVTAFCTVADVKLDLGITTTAQDERIAEYIDEVSDGIVAFCNREFARAVIAERVPGDGSRSLMVSRTPVVALDAITFESRTLRCAEVYSADGGILYHGDGFDDTRPVRQWIEAHIENDLSRQAFTVAYTGGFLMPGDDVLASGTLAVVASGTLRLTEGEWPILVSGDVIRTAGFTNAANNRRLTVQALNDLDVIVAEPLVDEDAGAVVTVRVRTLPASLAGAAREAVRDRYLARNRDSQVVSEKIGDWSATYRGGAGSSAATAEVNDGGFGPIVARKLQPWMRIV